MVTFARQDTAAAGGDVKKSGAPVDNQIAVWTASDTIEGTSDLVFDANGVNIGTGFEFLINSVSVLSATTLGGSVITSSLTTVGTIGTGVWQGTPVDPLLYLSISGGNAGEQLTVNEAETAYELNLSSKYLKARKGSAGTINKGEPVYVSGVHVGSSSVEVEVADASDPAKMPSVGMAYEEITNSANTRVLLFGLISDIDTNPTGETWVEADGIYIGSGALAGGIDYLTNVKPVGNDAIQKIGIVTRVNSSNGSMAVSGAGRANDVPNFSAADKYWYGGTSGVTTEGTVTAFARTILDDADAATVRTTISALANIVEDATPQLGGELDAGANSIGFTPQSATGDGTTTIDWKNGNKFNFTFGAFNEVFTFTAPTKSGNLILKMVQDSVGSRTATFPATVKWFGGGTPPVLTTTATTGTDIITLYFDGTNYWAQAALNGA